MSRTKTNWYVITGGPGSGKTTTVNLLSKLGYKVTIEHARHYIDTQMQQGRTVEEIKKNQEAFQMGVLDMQIEQEDMLSPDEEVFLDRALPDAFAYYQFLQLPINQKVIDALEKWEYKKIFVLDLLPLVQDYARREDEKAQKEIHHFLGEVYSSFGYSIIRVPALPPHERVNFILKRK